jgi:hypothetical protein
MSRIHKASKKGPKSARGCQESMTFRMSRTSSMVAFTEVSRTVVQLVANVTSAAPASTPKTTTGQTDYEGLVPNCSPLEHRA